MVAGATISVHDLDVVVRETKIVCGIAGKAGKIVAQTRVCLRLAQSRQEFGLGQPTPA